MGKLFEMVCNKMLCVITHAVKWSQVCNKVSAAWCCLIKAAVIREICLQQKVKRCRRERKLSGRCCYYHHHHHHRHRRCFQRCKSPECKGVLHVSMRAHAGSQQKIVLFLLLLLLLLLHQSNRSFRTLDCASVPLLWFLKFLKGRIRGQPAPLLKARHRKGKDGFCK